jgi:hypothetical protein
VDHELLENLVLDYLTEAAPKIKSLIEATVATDKEAARPLLEAFHFASNRRDGALLDMMAFIEEHLPRKAQRKATKKGFTTDEIYDKIFVAMRPTIEAGIAAKERELEELHGTCRTSRL